MLLVDIEMPKVCRDCPMLYRYDGDFGYTWDRNGCEILKMQFNEYRWGGNGEHLVDIDKERYSGCPLKEIILCKDCIKHNDDHSFCYSHCMKDDEFCSRALKKRSFRTVIPNDTRRNRSIKRTDKNHICAKKIV